jgi:glucosamine kinase
LQARAVSIAAALTASFNRSDRIRYSTSQCNAWEIFVITTPNPAVYLAIESGGGSTRMALAQEDGSVLHEVRCASASPLYRDRSAFATEFAGWLKRLLASEGVDQETIQVVGLAGPADAAIMHAELESALPGIPRVEHSEGELGLAHYGLSEGIAMVAGTGTSCHALDAKGSRSAIAGYGPQFGDEGSAYWIGREGLRAAFHAEQARIEPTALLDAARDFYHIESPWQILDEAGDGGHVPAPRVAAFAAAVDATAAEEDPRAKALMKEAGQHLATLILDMASRTEFDVMPIPLVMTGGVFHSSRVLASIEEALAAGPFVFRFQPVLLEPITGLIRLLQRDVTIRNS